LQEKRELMASNNSITFTIFIILLITFI
jgi:hypothetical protein